LDAGLMAPLVQAAWRLVHDASQARA